MITVTGLYTGILGIVFLLCAINVIKMRFKSEVGLGDGGDESLIKAIRIHGNFAEYIPIIILLMAFYEINGGNIALLHIIGIVLTLGRIMHAIGITKSIGTTIYRQFGVLSTFIILIILSILNIIHFF